MATLGCGELSKLDGGVCGNGVVDAPYEDCDSTAPPGLTCGTGSDSRKACRFVCEEAADCPGGWACSADGACVHGSGSFSDGSSTSAELDQWTLADADGDGALDLIGTRGKKIEVRYGDRKGYFSEPTSRAVDLIGEAWLGDADGDGIVDAAVPTPAGVVLFRGDRSRRGLVPLSLPTPGFGSSLGAADFWVTTASMPPAWTRPSSSPYQEPECDGVLLLTSVPGQGLKGTVVPVPIEDATHVQIIDPTVCAVGTNPSCFGQRAVRLERPASAPDTEGSSLLIAPAGEDHALIATVGIVDGWPNALPGQVLPLPAGLVVMPSGVALAGQGATPGELVLFVPGVDELGSARHLLRAIRDADGKPSKLELDLRFEPGGVCSGHPLAVADLDQDGELDFVMPQGLCRSAGLGAPLELELAFEPPLREAAVADLDGNGTLDVAGAGNAPAVEVVYLDGKWGSLRTALDAASPRFVRVAQLDGLGGSDLVFATREDDTQDRLLVAFGESDGLTVPQTMGIFSGLSRVESGYARDILDRCDTAAELVLSVRGSSAQGGVFPLFGSADRAIYAPVVLTRDALADLPMGALLGRTGKDSAWMLATAEGQGSNGTVSWLYALGAGLSGLKHVQLDALSCGKGVQRFAWTTADTNGDGSEEAIGVESDCDGAASSATLRVQVVSSSLPRAEWTVPVPIAKVRELAAHDLDGDGAIDLLIAREDGLLVLWGSAGGWSGSASILQSSEVTSLALLDADSGAGKELAFLAGSDVIVMSFDGREPVELTRLDAGKQAQRLRAGDVNGDGVDDLVVSDEHSVRSFFGVSHQAEH